MIMSFESYKIIQIWIYLWNNWRLFSNVKVCLIINCACITNLLSSFRSFTFSLPWICCSHFGLYYSRQGVRFEIMLKALAGDMQLKVYSCISTCTKIWALTVQPSLHFLKSILSYWSTNLEGDLAAVIIVYGAENGKAWVRQESKSNANERICRVEAILEKYKTKRPFLH